MKGKVTEKRMKGWFVWARQIELMQNQVDLDWFSFIAPKWKVSKVAKHFGLATKRGLQ